MAMLDKKETQPEGELIMDVKATGEEPIKTPTTKVAKHKPLPFDPAQLKAALPKSKEGSTAKTKQAGAKPTGVKKPTKTKPTHRSAKDATPSLDTMLADTRSWIDAPTTYMIRNPDTRCFGLSCRRAENERTEITIVHTADCECLDVRLLHVCQHVDGLVRARRLARRSRDAFVICIKIRMQLAAPVPKEMRFPPLTRQVIRRPENEVEEEDRVIFVVDVHNQQTLIEKWKNLEAYKERLIWKDW